MNAKMRRTNGEFITLQRGMAYPPSSSEEFFALAAAQSSVGLKPKSLAALQHRGDDMAAKTISSVVMNAREQLFFNLVQQQKRTSVDVRIHTKSGSQHFPTRDGFAVAPELLLELRNAVDQAIESARREGLLQ